MCDGDDREAVVDPSTDFGGKFLSALEAESHSAHYRFIIHYGTSFRPTDLPSGVTPGKERCCAWNSFHLARENPESYSYYEGLATHISASPGWPISHAWCVDPAGHVVDRTWVAEKIKPLAYRGVPLPLEVIRECIVEESAGFLDAQGTFAMFNDDIQRMAQFLGLGE
ncbi:MAG: hypothetical protein WAU69_04730 [Solirubrobacteraceae bacterium]|jgi:hypothetical protein